MPSDSSIKLYKSLLTRYVEDRDISNTRAIMRHLRTLGLAPSTIKNILSAIVWKLRQQKEGGEASDALEDYRAYISNMRGEAERRERDHTVTHGKIPQWEDVIKKRNEATGRDKVLLSLYTYIKPRRLQDFLYMIVVNSRSQTQDKEDNYYVLDEGVMIFNVYKTAKTYGTVEIKAPAELHKIIVQYVKDKNIKSGMSLLGYDGYIQMNRALNRLVGCSVNNLRHSFISKYYSQYNVPSSGELEDMAQEMGHSVQTNLRYRKT